jgi:hypothetical protein
MINYGFLGIIGYTLFFVGIILPDKPLFLTGLLLTLVSVGHILFVCEYEGSDEDKKDKRNDYHDPKDL